MGALLQPEVTLVPGVVVPVAFFDRSTTAMTVLREDGLIVYRNRATAELFRPPPEDDTQVIGKSILDMEPRSFFEERVSLMRRLVREERDGVVRDIWQGQQILTHLRLLPRQDSQALRLFLVVHQPVGGEQAPGPAAGSTYFHDPENQDLGPLALLSPRELEVLALVGQGMTAAQIAATIHRSEETVNTHRASLLRKLNCQNAVQLALIAYRAGLKYSDAARFA